MTDLLGLLAGAFVLASFSMRSMFWLGTFAIMSNVCFITYGVLMNLSPIGLLHALLLPMNCRYWVVCLRCRTARNNTRPERPYPGTPERTAPSLN